MTDRDLGPAAIGFTAKLVFIVDDDHAICKGVGRLLRSHGYDVLTFLSASDLLKTLATNRPDCLLLDIRMPVMDGHELQAHLAESGFQFPIIVITASTRTKARETALRLGAAAYLEKPLEAETLVNTIESVLSR